MTSILDTIKARAAARVETSGRPLTAHEFLGGLPADFPTEPVLVVVPLTIGESDAAAESALKYRRSVLAELGDKARLLIDEPSFFADAEAVEKLWLACRLPSDRTKRAFDTAQSIRDHLTMEEIAVLCSVLASAQRSASPIKTETLEDREALSQAIAKLDSPATTAMLERFPRQTLADCFAYECRAHEQTRQELLNLRVQVGQLTPEEAYGDFGARVAEAIGVNADMLPPPAGPVVEPAAEP